MYRRAREQEGAEGVLRERLGRKEGSQGDNYRIEMWVCRMRAVAEYVATAQSAILHSLGPPDPQTPFARPPSVSAMLVGLSSTRWGSLSRKQAIT